VSLAFSGRVRLGAFLLEAEIEVEAGRTVVIVGPNGAGKSAFVAAIAGLIPLEAGSIVFDGRAIEDAERGFRLPAKERNIGLLPQGGLLFPHMTLLENVAFPLRARGATRRDANAEAARWLDRLRIGHQAASRPPKVSGGEAQRAALARALIFRPDILILDEPFTSLDLTAREEARALLWSALEDFRGVRLFVTHDPSDAISHADRIVVIEAGRVTQAGTPKELRLNPSSPFLAAFLRGDRGYYPG
jgi:molybdate transport system ATP-binding protein